MNDHATIISSWPNGAKQFASDVGIQYATARKWKQRNAIPAVWWHDVVQAARRKKIGVSHTLLRQTTPSKYVNG